MPLSHIIVFTVNIIMSLLFIYINILAPLRCIIVFIVGPLPLQIKITCLTQSGPTRTIQMIYFERENNLTYMLTVFPHI